MRLKAKVGDWVLVKQLDTDAWALLQIAEVCSENGGYFGPGFVYEYEKHRQDLEISISGDSEMHDYLIISEEEAAIRTLACIGAA